MPRMTWDRLLSTKRIRALFGGPESVKSAGDPRTEFERDYGRSVFSAPVRRLQDKAQVFPLEQHDAVRTRLTHSVEVASVARGLARAIGTWISRERNELRAEYISGFESIAATCGIIHDLGNPPFGHAGEIAIAEWFKKTFANDSAFEAGSQYTQDFQKWDGNAQTIRLVGRLQVLADEFGLNLTCATMSVAQKYIAASHETDATRRETKKIGYFASEGDLVQSVRDEVGTGFARNPLTYIVEASDDIVYSTVDLEDGVKKHALTWGDLKSELVDTVGGADLHLKNAIESTEKIVKGSTFSNTVQDNDEIFIQLFRTYAINEFVLAVIAAFKTRYDSIMAGEYHSDLIEDCTASKLIQTCKLIAKREVYGKKDVLSIELAGRRIIEDLLNIFWEGAMVAEPGMDFKEFPGKAYALMSSNYRNVFEKRLTEARNHRSTIPEKYFRVQLACDYVAGMTDTFAATLHRNLTHA